MAEELEESGGTLAQTEPTEPTEVLEAQVEAPVETAEESTSSAPASLLERLDALGIDTSKFSDEGQATDFLLGAVEEYKQNSPYIQYGRVAASQWQDFQKWQAERQQQQPQQTAQEKKQEKAEQAAIEAFFSKLPQFELGIEEMAQYLTQDKDGNIVAKPGADPALPHKYREYLKAREKNFNKLLSDPEGFVNWVQKSVMTNANIDKLVDERVSQKLSQERLTSEVVGFLQQNYDKLFETDSLGNVRQTPLHDAMVARLDEARRMGMPQQSANQYAWAMAQADVGQQTARNVEHKKRYATHTPNRGGTMRNARVPQSDPTDIDALMAAEARKRGINMNAE